MTKYLLPSGCYDLLPPYAKQESELLYNLLSVFTGFGYEQVSPPLLEYSDSLLSGRGGSLSRNIFRIMDPIAHKVMGIRADITFQIARIAVTRLSHEPRPLRLCYSGTILRMQGEGLRNDRQLHQAGIELIGAESAEADAEVIIVATEALKKAGIEKISIDLNLPSIVGSLLSTEKFDNEQLQHLLNAISCKDISTIQNINFTYKDTLIGLIKSAGIADKAINIIDRLDLPDNAKREFANLKQVVEILKSRDNKNWEITIDATEIRSSDYHSGIGFSIFVDGVSCEVGRGGRYKIQGTSATSDCEATGFTLYLETLLDILPKPEKPKRVLISSGISDKTANELQEKGFVIIHALGEYGRCKEEAKRLGCGFIYKDGEIFEVG